jgi:hypothetical protein
VGGELFWNFVNYFFLMSKMSSSVLYAKYSDRVAASAFQARLQQFCSSPIRALRKIVFRITCSLPMAMIENR